jgi:hypothetical protein
MFYVGCGLMALSIYSGWSAVFGRILVNDPNVSIYQAKKMLIVTAFLEASFAVKMIGQGM